jgi:FlaA1/EpsC-like NDP-sugar epimerase
VHEIVIGMPSAPHEAVRDIIRICRRTSAEPRMLLAITRFLDKRVTLADLRTL